MNNSTTYCVIYCTCPNEETANKITDELLNKKLVACVNTLSNIASKYWWKGNIETDKEILLIMKTRKSLFLKVKESISRLHPYETPEIIALPIVEGNPAYLNWINDSVI